MNLDDIKASGLLEQYVLGDLSSAEQQQVEEALMVYPELKAELNEIEKALFAYAKAKAIDPRKGLLEETLAKLPKQSAAPSTANYWKLLSILGLLLTAALGTLAYYHSSELLTLENANNELKLQVAECQEAEAQKNQQIALFNQLNDKNNRIVPVQATEKYPDTRLYLYTNAATNTNLLKVHNLPALTADQSFQLWSLQGDNPPVPLDVFVDQDGVPVFEVKHIAQTDAYAITIEPKGGRQTPTLENLIGVFAVSG